VLDLIHGTTRRINRRTIGDYRTIKAYDSDPLDEELAKEKIGMIALHKQNRKKRATQDGRELRRYKRRWKVERLFAWLQNYRRIVIRYEYHGIVIRYEYHADNFLGFVYLGCILILLKAYL
jgi:transposase